MPQMNPMNWLMLFMVFSLSYVTILSKTYFMN